MRYLTFTTEAQKVIDRAFDLAATIWGDDCDFDAVRVLAGNYAGYGHYVAHYKPDSRIIEIPLNHSFSPVAIQADGIGVKNESKLLGIMLHELGHHVEHNKQSPPWRGITAGTSTHARASWCWVCATGWRHFFPVEFFYLDAELLATGIRRKVRGVHAALSRFEPNRNPAAVIERINRVEQQRTIQCEHCGTTFERKRSDARFCSPRCKSAAARVRAKACA